MSPHRKRFLFLAATSVAGILGSLWLLTLHLTSGALSGTCQVGSNISCDVLQLFQYSEWLGIPVPIFSLVFYGLTLAIAWSARNRDEKDQVRPAAYLWLLSWCAIASTLYFAALSLFVLKILCPYCAFLYVVSIVMLAATWRLQSKIGHAWGFLLTYDLKNRKSSRWTWLPVLVFVVLAVGVQFVPKKSGVTGARQNIDPIALRTLGDPNAPNVITIFSDFQCPYCKDAGEMMSMLEAEMRGRVRIVYKYYPLSNECNPSGGPGHAMACPAARASYCASLQDRFQVYHDLIYASQRGLDETKFFEFARTLQLDVPSFTTCYYDEDANEAIRKDVEEGTKLHVRATPTVFVNGRLFEGRLSVSALKDAVLQSGS